mmetsp:Transcript_101885/g.255353  ORF Transcript_101885/g.255353 Transcript_101885/m.255353 type:complete len:123 (-) Transcript_101885:90-458(-)
MRSSHRVSLMLAVFVAATDWSKLIAAEDFDFDLESHPLGPGCLDATESLERDFGLFDNSQMTAATRQEIAQRMQEVGTTLTGKTSSGFAWDFVQKLEIVQSGGGPFGAADACIFLLQNFGVL